MQTYPVNLLHEIIRNSLLCWFCSLISWRRVKRDDVLFACLVNFHDCSLVATTITIIWGTEQGNNLFIVSILKSIHDQLVSSHDLRKLIYMIKLLRTILPECVSRPARRDAPTAPIVWIRPDQVTQWSFVWHFHLTLQILYVINSIKRRRQATMWAKQII